MSSSSNNNHRSSLGIRGMCEGDIICCLKEQTCHLFGDVKVILTNIRYNIYNPPKSNFLLLSTHRHQQNPPGTNNYHFQNSPTDRLSSSPHRHLVEMQQSSDNRSPSPSFLVQQTSQYLDFPKRRSYIDSVSNGVNGERNGNVLNGGNNIDQTDDSCLRRRDEEIAFEREYVVIDPSQIDVNAFADGMKILTNSYGRKFEDVNFI